MTTNWKLRLLALAAAVFGVMTIASGGRALFGGEAARAAVGAFVPFVLWFNFLAGFAYVAAAAAILFEHRLAGPLAAVLAAATLTVFLLFGIAVALGIPYEARTVGAMTLRSGFWLAAALLIRRWSTAS